MGHDLKRLLKQASPDTQDLNADLLEQAEKRNKYGARKTERDGIMFDSLAEADRHSELVLLEKAGVIARLTLQPAFTLQAGYTDRWGRAHRSITYTADFQYVDMETGETVVEDVKGVETKDFRIRFKWAQRLHPDLRFEVVTDGC